MSVKKAFDESVEYYDAWVRKALPHYEQIFEAALDSIPYKHDQTFTVLDLGAGTGLFAHHVHKRFPAARFRLCDISSEMLEVARKRFHDCANVTDYLVKDYGSEILPPENGLIISSLQSITRITSRSSCCFERFKKRSIPAEFS